MLYEQASRYDMNDNTRILPRQPIDDGQNDALCQTRRCPDPQFSHGRIREEVDVLHGLRNLVEGGNAAFEQRATVLRRLDSLWTAVEDRDAERVLHLGDRS